MSITNYCTNCQLKFVTSNAENFCPECYCKVVTDKEAMATDQVSQHYMHDLAMREVNKLRDENEKLKRLCRYQYLTLGFYGTRFNYQEKIEFPDGSRENNITRDNGHDARQASILARRIFNADEICGWPGPKEEELKGVWEEANA